jgi:hypothetical protein
MKKIGQLLVLLAVLLSTPVLAQSGSYLDTVYQTYNSATASETDPIGH